jgi:hypothetical protein
MGLPLYPIETNLPGRRKMRLDIEADILLKLLQGLDGKRRIQTKGLPKDVRCVGLAIDRIFNTVSLLLESPDWPEVRAEYTAAQLNIHFAEFFGDAMPEPEVAANGTTG